MSKRKTRMRFQRNQGRAASSRPAVDKVPDRQAEPTVLKAAKRQGLREPKPHDWRALFAHLAFGIAIATLLVGAKVLFEHTRAGAMLEQRTYGLLTTILPQFLPDGPDVVVIDIGHLAGGTEDAGTGVPVATPRPELQRILETLVQMRPRAIGVDIDFSPTPRGWGDDSDPQFFQRVLELSEATPITLGVFRSIREPKEAWLGLPRYSSLAGSMWLPRTGLERTPAWTQAPGVADRLPSLGAKTALARAARTDEGQLETGWLRRFRESKQQSSLRPDGLLVGEILTNSSPMAQLQREAIKIARPEDLIRHRSTIEGRIVLLGVVDNANDLFPVPAEERNVPGVIVHAANAYTLASEPVWEFSHGTRYALDFAFSGLLIGIALWMQRTGVSKHALPSGRSESRALWCVIAATLIGGAVAVLMFRVFWLDFLLVAASLWLHPRVERLLSRWRRRIQPPTSQALLAAPPQP